MLTFYTLSLHTYIYKVFTSTSFRFPRSEGWKFSLKLRRKVYIPCHILQKCLVYITYVGVVTMPVETQSHGTSCKAYRVINWRSMSVNVWAPLRKCVLDGGVAQFVRFVVKSVDGHRPGTNIYCIKKKESAFDCQYVRCLARCERMAITT